MMVNHGLPFIQVIFIHLCHCELAVRVPGSVSGGRGVLKGRIIGGRLGREQNTALDCFAGNS